MKIGVISDTHDYFDPRIPEVFEEVEHIIHAGDIGTAAILAELEKIAPVTAVIGNSDSMLPLKETEVFEPRVHPELLQLQIIREKPDMVVFGHTHKPYSEKIRGVHYFNPGYAGRSRFGLERTVALLHFVRGEIEPEFLKL
jgi:predicted phosphodiesterase